MADITELDGEVQALRTEVEQLYDKIDLLLRLQRYSYELAGEQNLDRLLQLFVDASRHLLSAHSSSLLLVDEQTGELVFALIGGGEDTAFRDIRLKPGEGVVGRVVATGQPEIVNDVRSDPNWSANVDNMTKFSTHSLAVVPLIVGERTIGAIEVVNKMVTSADGRQAIDPLGFTIADRDILIALASQAAIAIDRTRLLQYMADEQRRLVAVQEDVRRKIQRDLHDGPAQRLTAMVMNIKFIQQCLERLPERVPSELAELENLANRTSREIRTLLFELRPIVLQTQGLIPALEQYVARLNDDGLQTALVINRQHHYTPNGNGLPDGLAIARPEDRLPVEIENTVFTIVQEAVNNSKKHAHASQLRIELQYLTNELVATVSDNGAGFNIEEIVRNYDQRGSFGLLTMRERAEMVHGSWTLDSMPGQGTTVTLRIPMSPPEAATPKFMPHIPR